jgi:hypothetical protein
MIPIRARVEETLGWKALVPHYLESIDLSSM